MCILDEIRNIKESNTYDRNTIEQIADKLEECIGPAQMWITLRPGFSIDELIENLEYIAKENDL